MIQERVNIRGKNVPFGTFFYDNFFYDNYLEMLKSKKGKMLRMEKGVRKNEDTDKTNTNV